MKRVIGIRTNRQGHWVGDGFPVRSLFSYNDLGAQVSPFLLLDYAGPMDFAPAAKPRGVGEHPHRGFETVTLVYEGEVSHQDSAGNGGTIGPGDVQWMTAASGLLHEEFHSPEFTRKGGRLRMVQLWVNLPAKDKMTPPRYQALLAAQMGRVALDERGSTATLVAGELDGARGPAATHTPINVWDLRLKAGATIELPLPEGHNAVVVLLEGKAAVNDSRPLVDAEFALLSPTGAGATLSAENDSIVLVLTGEPIREPIAGYGPFVMNTREEIITAMRDFEAGKFGKMPADSVSRRGVA